jgi:two-component system NarL family sensor kinase
LAALRTQSPSLQRDTAIILSLSLLTERSHNLGDARKQYFLDSLKRFTQQTNWPKGLGLYERALGKQNDVKGNYAEALKHYDNAIQLLKKAGGDSYELGYAYVLAAFVLNNNGLTNKCLEYLNEALPYAKSHQKQKQPLLDLRLFWATTITTIRLASGITKRHCITTKK